MEAVTETFVPITENYNVDTHRLENLKSHTVTGCCEHGPSGSKGRELQVNEQLLALSKISVALSYLGNSHVGNV
jgi:hypothetical protein